MAAEQRIIGGGFLIVGVAIVLVLLFYIAPWSSRDPQKAHDEILSTAYPAYLAAEQDWNYLAIKRQAGRILDELKTGGRAAVLRAFQGDSSTGNKRAQQLLDRVRAHEFENNAQGRYRFDNGWYRAESHHALLNLAAAVEKMKALRRIRDTAGAAREALADARLGSGLALEYPPAKLVPQDEVPIVSPNPVYQHDADLDRVFGLPSEDLRAALSTPDPGPGRARPARLRWNRDVTSSSLADDVDAVPEQAEGLRAVAVDIERSARSLASDPVAAKQLAGYLAKAAGILEADLEGEQRKAFEAHRAGFETGIAISTILRREAEMLAPYLTTIRDLAKTFRIKFKG